MCLANHADRIRLFVRDTGRGIPKKVEYQLFHIFCENGSSATRKHAGTGLGLALVNSLVEEMLGEVGVVCDPEDTESVFWVDFNFFPDPRPVVDVLVVDGCPELLHSLSNPFP
ncbi:MAG: ATP-binding protein [Myxococcota bacterium]|nr:ATP-binding protein [Myxococcota bacterium]